MPVLYEFICLILLVAQKYVEYCPFLMHHALKNLDGVPCFPNILMTSFTKIV